MGAAGVALTVSASKLASVLVLAALLRDNNNITRSASYTPLTMRFTNKCLSFLHLQRCRLLGDVSKVIYRGLKKVKLFISKQRKSHRNDDFPPLQSQHFPRNNVIGSNHVRDTISFDCDLDHSLCGMCVGDGWRYRSKT